MDLWDAPLRASSRGKKRMDQFHLHKKAIYDCLVFKARWLYVFCIGFSVMAIPMVFFFFDPTPFLGISGFSFKFPFSKYQFTIQTNRDGVIFIPSSGLNTVLSWYIWGTIWPANPSYPFNRCQYSPIPMYHWSC